MSEKNRRIRVTPIFIGISIFIVLVLGLINYELNTNKSRIIDFYNNTQNQNVQSLSLVIQEKQNDGLSGSELNNEIYGMFQAKGSCYVVFESGDEILYSKTPAITMKLYDNKNSAVYWEEVKKTDVQVSSSSWTYDDNDYKVSIVTETDSIFEDNNLVLHDYYILLTSIIVCIVLFSMLVTYVGLLAKTTKSLTKAQNDLITRNVDIENYITEEQNSVKNTNGPHTDAEFEKSYSNLERYFDVSVLRSLISKSNKDDLKPIRMITLKFVMTNRYYSKNEISIFAQKLVNIQKQREVLFEIRKGLFAVVIFKASAAEASLRERDFLSVLDSENKKSHLFLGFESNTYELGSGQSPAIEDLEVTIREITGEGK